MDYKKTLARSLSALMIAGLLAPMASFAQGGNSPGSGVQGNICERAETITEKIEERFSNIEGRINERREQIEERVEDRHESQKQRREEMTARAREQREEHFANIRERAKTAEQQEAVETYITTVTNAYELHDSNASAILDEAWNTDNLTLQYYTIISDALSVYKTIVLEAVENAKEDCENGVDIEIIRDELRKITSEARDIFRETKRDSADSIRDDVRIIIDGVRDNLEESRNTLRNSLREAQETLRNSLRSNSQ